MGFLWDAQRLSGVNEMQVVDAVGTGDVPDVGAVTQSDGGQRLAGLDGVPRAASGGRGGHGRGDQAGAELPRCRRAGWGRPRRVGDRQVVAGVDAAWVDGGVAGGNRVGVGGVSAGDGVERFTALDDVVALDGGTVHAEALRGDDRRGDGRLGNRRRWGRRRRRCCGLGGQGGGRAIHAASLNRDLCSV